MFNNFIIALIVGAGGGYLVYNKLVKSSGGNTKNAAIASAIVAFLIAVIGTVLLNIFLKK